MTPKGWFFFFLHLSLKSFGLYEQRLILSLISHSDDEFKMNAHLNQIPLVGKKIIMTPVIFFLLIRASSQK